MILRPEYNLFNAADNTLKAYLRQDDFEKSLLFNVLFQDKMLIHGSYFFDSTLLANHIKKPIGDISLFEAAARKGLIVPIYGDKSITTIRENYEWMLQVYGKEYKLLSDEHDKLRYARMCDHVDAGRELQDAFYAPVDKVMSEGYHEVLKKFLQNDKDELPKYIQQNPFRHAAIVNYWKLTKKWRYDFIDQALENTQKKGQKGLQRTELIKLIAKDVGLSEAIALDAKNNISDFVEDRAKRKLINIFQKWIAQCHHLNMARTLDSALNFPVYNTSEDFLCESITRMPVDGQISKYEGFECTVYLPPLKSLLRENHSSLISIRQELGNSYLIALREWQQSPTEKNQENVMWHFKAYCNSICDRYKKNTQPVGLKATYTAGTGLGEKFLDVVGSVVSIESPLVGVFMSASKLGYAVYEYFTGKQKSKPRQTTLEINLREASKQYDKIL